MAKKTTRAIFTQKKGDKIPLNVMIDPDLKQRLETINLSLAELQSNLVFNLSDLVEEEIEKIVLHAEKELQQLKLEKNEPQQHSFTAEAIL